jgi:predicted RNase H-like HicB family nuclease
LVNWICALECLLKLKYKICMTLKAIIHDAEEGGFWAEVPALPGCVTQAETQAELTANLREAIALWLSVDDEAMESNANDKVLELTV